MFAHTCTTCHRRELIFPSQITGMETTEHGIVVSFTCWCDAPQTMLTGVNATHPTPASTGARAAAA
jgi:hypothetical protein